MQAKHTKHIEEVQPGDIVDIIETDKSTISGTIMPSRDDDFIVLKLKNGYNIGISKKNIEKLTIIETQKKKEYLPKGIKQDPKLPKVLILHTGGTIASKIDYNTGGVIASFRPEQLLSMIPELSKIAHIDSVLVANLMSENMRFGHYNLMGKEVEKQIRSGTEYKGIIVTHGTDTMHYTAAALSFMLEGLKIPIVLTGSQRSSDRGSSDGAINVLSAARFIVKSGRPGVWICMHEDQNDANCLIISGTKARKMHTTRRDTFRPINTLPFARVNYQKEDIEIFQEKNVGENYPLYTDTKFTLRLFDEKLRVGLLKSRPNLHKEEISAYHGFDGLVIEGTGLGHLPIVSTDKESEENSEIGAALKKICKDTVVAMSAQTIYGRVNMRVYSAGRELIKLGVVGNNSDMTPETTYIKLSWLLSNYSKEETKKLMGVNLRGELLPRTIRSAFLN